MAYNSKIAAIVIVSESEISEVYPDYDSSWEKTSPEKLKDILFSFGLDISQLYQRQDGLTHRNMMNQVVLCSRWVGNSRQDSAWVESGYASKEAIDKAAGSKILDDLYRSKYLTEDAQQMLEARDRGSNRGNSKREG